MSKPKNIETRYRVAIVFGKAEFFVVKVDGEIRGTTVKVPRIWATNHRARMSLEEWRRFALTPDEAREKHLKKLLIAVHDAEWKAKQATEDHTRALKDAPNYPVVEDTGPACSIKE